MDPRQRRLLRVLARCVVCWLVFFAAAAQAQVKPGDFIGADNARKVKELLPPGVYWRVEHGMTLKIARTGRIEWPPPYKDATEKYSSQVKLSPDHRSLVGYVAGQPFPIIDANDPYAAVKVMWNNAFRPMYSDDLDARFFGCHGRYEEREKGEHEVEYEEIGHYRIYNEVGRTEVKPLPVIRISKSPADIFSPRSIRCSRLRRFAAGPSCAIAMRIPIAGTTHGSGSRAPGVFAA